MQAWPAATKLIGAINFLAMFLSVPIIGARIWLSTQADNTCVKFFQWPVIAGILVLIAALIGFVGGFWQVSWLLSLYLIAMVILIILLATLVVSIFMVTNKGSGHLAPDRIYLEYRLDDYSSWLRRRVESPLKWGRIKSCLASTYMCEGLDQIYRLAQDFFNAPITPLQNCIELRVRNYLEKR